MKSNGIIYIFWTFLSIQQFTSSLGKAYPNLVSSTNQYFESLCYNETNNERYVESDSRRSSFFLELHSNAMMRKKFCERNFTTSESHGFIIRLIIAKNKLFSVTSSISSSNINSNSNIHNNNNNNNNNNVNINSNSNTMLSSQRNNGKSVAFKNNDVNNKYHGSINHQNKNQFNATKSCPLTIYSNIDYHYEQILWQIDPCELEKDENNFGNENNWPVKFFEGHIKIRWEHNHNSIYSKLMITALGKGDACNKPNKFPCLILSGSPLFCISRDLICDNIRHCPNGNLYDDDEDKKMCDEMNLRPALFPPPTTVIFDNEWEQQLMLWMQHAFGEFSPSFSASSSSSLASSSGLPPEFSLFGDDIINEKEYHDGRPNLAGQQNDNRPFQENENGYNINNDDDDDDEDKHNKKVITTITTSPSSTTTTSKKNQTKSTLTGDLSKYGPWGYLMLGMLLCGGALLICGLWECCCRNNKNESHITASTLVGNTTSLGDGAETTQSSSRINHQNITPPNYDELDPPPAYSVLFPNQKATTASGAVIESTQQQQQRPQLPPPPSPMLEPPPPPPFSSVGIDAGITDNTMVTVPVVVVVSGGARNNNNNSNNNNRNNQTSDLTPASSS